MVHFTAYFVPNITPERGRGTAGAPAAASLDLPLLSRQSLALSHTAGDCHSQTGS